MCGIAGAFHQPDGQGLVRADDRAHRATAGPDAVRTRRASGRCAGPAGASPAVDHRPVDGGGPAVRQGRPAPELQRRALQLPRAARRAAERGRRGSGRESDTEVVLEAWRAWGTAGARRGSAACSRSRSTTSARRRLTLARDPLGIKPLYVMPRGDGVLFASELKASWPPSAAELSVDPAGAWWRRRCSTACPRNDARSQGVHKLPPGSWAEWRRRRHDPERHATGSAAEAGARAAAAGPDRIWRPCSRSRSRRTSSPTCRWRRSSAAVSTPASSRRWPASHDPGDRGVHHHLPGRGPASGGDARRRGLCPQDGRAPGDPSCTRSRSARTSWTCCRGSSTSSTSRSATRLPSTPC